MKVFFCVFVARYFTGVDSLNSSAAELQKVSSSENDEIAAVPLGIAWRRNQFMLRYYPLKWPRPSGIKWDQQRWIGGRRRHLAYVPGRFWFHRGNREVQDALFEWIPRHGGGHRLYMRSRNKCLDARKAHQGALTMWTCHNGGNQHFWTETWGADRKKKAWHLHIGGHLSSRRRHACIEYGGGRFYINGCRDRDKQRFAAIYKNQAYPPAKFSPVKLITKTFPEKISWTIETTRKRKRTICSGQGYSNWYSIMKIPCKLRQKEIYKVTCMDKFAGEGWGGGYLQIGRRKVCNKWEWNGGYKQVVNVKAL
jgi:hypothetical protein